MNPKKSVKSSGMSTPDVCGLSRGFDNALVFIVKGISVRVMIHRIRLQFIPKGLGGCLLGAGVKSPLIGTLVRTPGMWRGR
jgi:hypothetical protein